MSSNQEIAKTILAQLGGNRFLAMTGAGNLQVMGGVGQPGLQFTIPRANGIQRVQIVLAGDDLYTMAFYKFNARKLSLEPVGQHVNGVYADQLQSIFKARTGLDTHL